MTPTHAANRHRKPASPGWKLFALTCAAATVGAILSLSNVAQLSLAAVAATALALGYSISNSAHQVDA